MVAVSVSSAQNKWTGTSGNNWFNDGNWSLGHYPAAGEDVIITNAGSAVLLTNQTPWLSSLTISNKTLTCSNWFAVIQATNVTVRRLGTITLPTAFATNGMSNRVWISCGNLTMDAGSTILATGRGYKSPQGPGRGRGDWHGAGAGHGGTGGGSSSYPTGGGYTYGSTNEPICPGSGGGGGAAAACYGGGAVRIEATGTVTINGSIMANGSNTTAYGYGGGAGGSVYITCNTFGGTTNGVINVNGGNTDPTYSGGGGGGRIAVNYSSLAVNRSVRFSATYGNTYQNTSYRPDVGTLWLPDNQLLTAVMKDRLFTDIRIVIPSFTAWRPGSLTVSNCWFTIEQRNFVLAVTNAVRIHNGGLGVWGTLSTRSGNLVLTNSGRLYVYSGPTNGTAGHYGALVSVTGDIAVAGGCWIYPYPDLNNGGAALIRGSNVTTAAGGGFNAVGLAYSPGKGPGTPGNLWHGPGAGHGGKGGRSSNYATQGQAYDRTNAPIIPGSGGGHDSSGGAGGGTVRIKATGTFTHNGTIDVSGGGVSSYGGGGGAGGSVFIACKMFRGSYTGAVVRADGSSNPDNRYAGGGGGGRIVIAESLPDGDINTLLSGGTPARLTVYYTQPGYAGSLSVTGGTGYQNGETGTTRYLAPYFMLTILGVPAFWDSPSPDGYGLRADIPDGTWVTNRVTSPANTADGLRKACTGYKLTNAVGIVSSGSGTQVVFQMTTNLWLTWYWTNQYQLTVSAGPNGSVNDGVVNGWYTQGFVRANILATPDPGYAFNVWTGTNVPAGLEQSNPMTTTMTERRVMQASFSYTGVQTRVWTGNGNWESAGNWNPAGMPSSWDHAIIASGRVILGYPRFIRTLVVTNGATLVFSNWTARLTVSNVTVKSGGKVTLPAAFAASQMSNRVHFVCTNLTIDAGGTLEANGKGWMATNGPGKGSGAWHSTGGGYGGKGGRANNNTPDQGPAYGSVSAPEAPGSGGGGVAAGGGHGGGAVRIQASGAVTINGLITANGSNTTSYGYGGGSGGGVYITCQTFGGTTSGLIRANGGTPVNSGWHSGGGGGGRIAVIYTSLANPHATRFQAQASPGGYAESYPEIRWPWASEVGTVWLSSTSILSSTINNGQFGGCVLVIPGFSSWTVGNLLVSNATVRFGDHGFYLNVTNDLRIVSGGLSIGGSNGNARVKVGRDLILTNSGSLSVYSGVSTGGGIGANIQVGRAVGIGSSSWLYPYSHPTNGGSVLLTAGRLSVLAGGGVNANSRGYKSALGDGKGQDATSWHSGGGGYGGNGGKGNSSYLGGLPYGYTNAPTKPGSGGGGVRGGYGGGLVHAELNGPAVVDGTITANGGQSVCYAYGGGSGGGVFLKCSSLSGSASGVLRANGETPDLSGGAHSGGGGGGRVVVWHGFINRTTIDLVMADPDNPNLLSSITWSGSPPSQYQGTTAVTGGIGFSNGAPGTVNFMYMEMPRGSVFMFR